MRTGRRLVWLAVRVFVGLLATAALAGIASPAAGAARVPAVCAGLPVVSSKQVMAFVAAVTAGDHPRFSNGVCLTVPLRFSKPVEGPFVLRDSVLTQGVFARSTSFRGIVDLSGTTIAKGADFDSAEFGRQAEFGETILEGATTFAAAEFHGAAVFADADFRSADFASVAFDHGADFTGATFEGTARFDNAGLAQQSRFSSAHFLGDAGFQSVQFGGGCDFSSVVFAGAATFDLSTARGDLGFQGAKFTGGDGSRSSVTFLKALVTGTADFSGAGTIRGGPVFDDAVIASLDFAGAEAEFFGTPTRIDKLQIDPGAVARIQFSGTAAERAAKYGTLETAAGDGGDLAAANEARVLRLGLLRTSEAWPLHALDWAFAWGVGGYLVRPSHPVLALVALFLIGVAARSFADRRERAGFAGWLNGLIADGQRAFSAFKKVKPADLRGFASLECIAYTVLTVLLLVNLEGVSPRIHNLVQELLP